MPRPPVLPVLDWNEIFSAGQDLGQPRPGPVAHGGEGGGHAGRRGGRSLRAGRGGVMRRAVTLATTATLVAGGILASGKPVSFDEVAAAIDGRVVRGRIDAVFAIEGEHWIVDWKTGAAGRADPLQLALYRIAWAAEQGIDPGQVVGCFVHVRQRRYEVYRGLPDAGSLTAVAGGGAVPEPTMSVPWEV